MKKKLTDYRWFKWYRDSCIGIKSFGRTFYATRRHRRKSCGWCAFYNDKICELSVEVTNNIPKTECFPCISNISVYTFSRDQEDGLLIVINKLCDEEDSFDDTTLDDLIK